MNWKDLSRYRTALMGIFCIWIMVFHNKFQWTGDSIVRDFVSKGNVGVDAFLMLSGIGLYYSFTRNSSLKTFFKKRFVRLLVPYILFAVPFYIWLACYNDAGAAGFFKHIFQVEWVMSSSHTTWFVPCIAILYLLFPIIYYLQNRQPLVVSNRISRNSVTVIMCVVWFCLLIAAQYFFPNKYVNTEMALTRVIIFILGCHFGKYVMEGKRIPNGIPLLCGAFFIIYVCVFTQDVKLTHFWERMSYVFLGIACTIFFAWILKVIAEKFKKKDPRFRVLEYIGSMSLELYLVHIFLRRFYSVYIGFPRIEPTGVADYFLVIAAAIGVCAATRPLIGLISRKLLGGKKAAKT